MYTYTIDVNNVAEVALLIFVFHNLPPSLYSVSGPNDDAWLVIFPYADNPLFSDSEKKITIRHNFLTSTSASSSKAYD
jgi:hypothetical protein